MHPGKPLNWNIVILGAWNPSILTPDWVREHMFHAPQGTSVEVQVALDRPAPMRIRHEGVTITPAADRLIGACTSNDDDSIKRVGVVLGRAVLALSRTPLAAAGVNRRYRFDAIPPTVADVVCSPLDEKLTKSGRPPGVRVVKRRIPWNNGLLNLEIAVDEAKPLGTITFNYELISNDADSLCKWIGRTDDMGRDAREILNSILKVEVSGDDDDDDDDN
jgi:hypothetical protein